MEMETTFKVKVRRIGSSLGVLIPKQMIGKKKIKEGEEIEISLLKRRKDLIIKAFGVAKGAGPFIRENVDRV
jgi:antitoxin component of MazEF toxin-antitoxin module